MNSRMTVSTNLKLLEAILVAVDRNGLKVLFRNFFDSFHRCPSWQVIIRLKGGFIFKRKFCFEMEIEDLETFNEYCQRVSNTRKLILIKESKTITNLQTIEGQDSAVLNCAFYNNGIQILSCGSDGLIKVWSIKGGECVTTLDQHAAKVWAIAGKLSLALMQRDRRHYIRFNFWRNCVCGSTVRRDESEIVTGGVDSRMIFWKDRTEENRLEDIKSGQEKVKQEQLLANLIKANELLPALQLAIKLDRPMQTYKIVESE